MKYKMKTIFGVSSATPINKKLKNGYTMYDWVKRQKFFPDFCMRAISGDGKLTAKEIEFLKEKNCKIGLIFNDLTELGVSGISGTEDALRAVQIAKDLGVPENRGIALFAEIKPEWSVNHNWMISFARLVLANGYLPAFIGNTDSSKNFNFDRQSSHFVQATRNEDCFGAIFMATEPKQETVPQKWEPYCPSALEPEDISLWCCGTTTFDTIFVEDVYAIDEKVLENMW